MKRADHCKRSPHCYLRIIWKPNNCVCGPGTELEGALEGGHQEPLPSDGGKSRGPAGRRLMSKL